MKNSATHTFDLDRFEKIEDILFLDEPILSHLKKGQKDYFLYLVESTEATDVFLLFELTEEKIYNYLTNSVSLRDLIVENHNFIYLVEQDFEGNTVNSEVLESYEVNNEYLPLADSLLNYAPAEDSYYKSLIEKFERRSYLNKLREKAFYLKFESKNEKYGETIGLTELVNYLLQNLSSSYKSFIKADFHAAFKEVQTDKKKLLQNFGKVKAELDLRMVDVDFGSFEIAFAVDEIMKRSIEDKKIFEWAVDVGYKYKRLVLDGDYNNATVTNILESYEPNERRKIFEPIFQITEDPNFNLNIKDQKQQKYVRINIKDKNVIKKIVPEKPVRVEEEHKEYEVIQVTTVVDKKRSKTSIKLDQNTLFDSYDSAEYILRRKDFLKYNFHLDFEVEIPLIIKTEKDKINLTARYNEAQFQASATAKMEDGMKQIISKIYEYILQL